MLRRLLIVCGLVAIFAMGRSSIAGDNGFVVIINPQLDASRLDRDFVRDAYLKKTTSWPGGATIRPIDLTSKFEAREAFTRKVIGKTPSQLKTYWNQQIFSGKGVPPPETDSPESVVDYVVANPGAIGYLPAGTDPGQARVVQVQ